MKIYLAGPCDSENRTLMVSIAKQLRDMKYEVYCPFELKIENAWDMSQEEWANRVFHADITAIKDCDFVVMISHGRISSAGTNWEQGYAYALKKPIYVFQITNEPTSLMTFCGCTEFWNTNKYDVVNQIAKVINYLEENSLDPNRSQYCRMVLT